MDNHKITCDQCDADLTYSGPIEYRLVVGSQAKTPSPGVGAVTAIANYPPTQRTHHFCGWKCFDKWRDAARATRETTP